MATDGQAHGRRDRRALEAVHAVRLAGAVQGVADRGRSRGRHLLLGRRRQALHRLQQPADGREHRPRRPARDRRDAAAGRTLAYISPFMAYEERALLGQKLAELFPGDIEKSFFTLGGAEANENAIRIARMVTGRHKIMARYRSYHGATTGAMTLTGDPRRWANEPAMSGVVHVLDPYHGPQRPQDDAETALAQPGRDDPARGPRHDRRVLPGDRDRHERHPDPARRLPAGRPRALHEVRHPDGERRGHVRLRPDRRVVRGEPLGRRPRHHHVRQGPHVVVRAARRARHAAGDRRPLRRTTCSSAA